MSNEMIRSKPLRRAMAAAPTTPPAGPESTVRTGSRAADVSAVIPPLDCIKKMLLFPLLECARRAFEQGERSEEHTSELQSPCNLVCRLLLEKKKKSTLRTKRRTAPIQCQDSTQQSHNQVR